jgi:hypothetical protein
MSFKSYLHGVQSATRSLLLRCAYGRDPETEAEQVFARAQEILKNPRYLSELSHLGSQQAREVIDAVLAGRVAVGALSVPEWFPPELDCAEATSCTID